MKICVIGTSNAIVKNGWFDGFKAQSCWQLDRYALGGAPVVQFLYLLERIDFSSYDAVVIDSLPNDESYMGHIGQDNFFFKLVFDFFNFINNRCKVFYLAFPTEKCLVEPSFVSNQYREIFSRIGIYYVDCSSIIREAVAIGKSYIDNYHPDRSVSYSIGEKLSKLIAGVLADASRNSSIDHVSRNVSLPGCNNRYCLVEKFAAVPNHSLHVENSVIKSDFYQLDLSSSVAFDRSYFLLGFKINSGRSSGVLEIVSPYGNRFVWCNFENEYSEDIVRFVPIKNGIWASAVKVVKAHRSVDVALHSKLPAFKNEVYLNDFQVLVGDPCDTDIPLTGKRINKDFLVDLS